MRHATAARRQATASWLVGHLLVAALVSSAPWPVGALANDTVAGSGNATDALPAAAVSSVAAVPATTVPAAGDSVAGANATANSTVAVAQGHTSWGHWWRGTWFAAWLPSLEYAVQVAQAAPNLSILLTAVVTAGVQGPLFDWRTRWTILAPTDAAFAALLRELKLTPEQLLGDKQLLTAVLSYHVIPDSSLTSRDLRDRGRYATALRDAHLVARVSKKSGVRFHDENGRVARVTVANIRAGRSTIHVIDTVLLPEL